MALTQEQRIEKQARALFLALGKVATLNDGTRIAVVRRTAELLEANGLVITADGVRQIATRYAQVL